MERRVRAFLAGLRQIVRHVQLYPEGHPLTDEVIASGTAASNEVLAEADHVVITLLGDAFFSDRSLLAHTSLEFNSLLREMQGRGVDSITLLKPVLPHDLADLGSFIAGVSDDVPASGTVRLNEKPLSDGELDDSEMSGLRSSYASSLDVLRSVGLALKGGADFELSGAVWAVERLVEQSLSRPGASLLLATVKGHDEYTFYHSINTCILSLALGRFLDLGEDLLVSMGLGALLHDIGKLGVSAAILQHPGRLGPEQWAEIKLHPQEGAQAILAAAGPGQEVAAAIAFQHHARFDGSGYPKVVASSPSGNGDSHGHHHRDRREGPPLHFFSRLVSVSDTYDAITTRRSYRRAETPNRALDVLLNAAGTSYDPDFVRAFIHMMGVYPAGSLLQLRTGEIVMVTHQFGEESARLAAVVVSDQNGTILDEPEPRSFDKNEVIDQLLPDRVGVDPAALLEKVGVQETLQP